MIDVSKSLFFLLFFQMLLLSSVCGQSSQEIDTLQSNAQWEEYVFPSESRANKLAESLRKELIVVNSDFMSWIDFTGSLLSEQIGSDQHGQLKYSRPAWLLLCTLMLFLFIALVKMFFPMDFLLVIRAFYNERILLQVSKEDNMVTSWPYIFLYIIFSFSLGLFLTAIQAIGGYDQISFQSFIQVSLMIATLFILKILVVRFISYVFELDKMVKEYIAVLYLLYFNTTLIVLPFLLAVTLMSVESYKILIILFSVIVSILFVYRFSKTAFHLFSSGRFSIFYLILYLCSLEIAPILILVKTLRY